MKSRAEKVCHETKRRSELNHLRPVFSANGYPDRLLKQTLSEHPTPTNHSITTVAERPAMKPLFMPYVQGITDKIERVCHPLGVKVICSSRGKLRETLVRSRNPCLS